MITAHVRIEDSTIVIVEQVKQGEQKTKRQTETDLVLLCHDAFRGEMSDRIKVTHVQAGAIIALAFGGEDFPPEVTATLYKIVEPIVSRMLDTVRPIP